MRHVLPQRRILLRQNDQVHTPTRVTQRCLREDLSDDWDDTYDHRMVQLGQAGVDKAVHLLQHKLIRKAVDDFPMSGDVLKERESISGLTDPHFWKVKTDRWRGAVYVERDSGQAWLVAAGLRRAGEKADFYAKFMSDVQRRGAEYFLPDQYDRDLLANERDEACLTEREKRVSALAVNLLHEALHDPDGCVEASLPRVFSPDGASHTASSLARIVLIVDRGDEDGCDPAILVELAVQDWSSPQLLYWDEQVFLAALCPQEDRWGTTQTNVRMHSLNTSLDELRTMASGDMVTEPLGNMHPGTTSHQVHRQRLTEATVVGQPVRALCGKWFVPRQDHESKPVCEICETILKVIPAANAGH